MNLAAGPEVLVVGDARLDLVLRGDVRPRFGQAEQLVDTADVALGGSGALVAHGLARLGLRVALCAAVGNDDLGARTMRLLRDGGVDTSYVVRRDGAVTGLSVVLSDGDRAVLTHLGTIGSLAAEDVPDPAGLGIAHLHVASPYLLTELRARLPELLGVARAAGAATSLDTDDDPERAFDGLKELLGAADVALPDMDEVLRWAQAMDLPVSGWRAAARAIAEFGPRLVVKCGADGGTLVTRSGLFASFPPAGLEPVDTTGAGASFVAGWIAATVRGLTDSEALDHAVHAGALATREPGGAAGQPTPDELRASLS